MFVWAEGSPEKYGGPCIKRWIHLPGALKDIQFATTTTTTTNSYFSPAYIRMHTRCALRYSAYLQKSKFITKLHFFFALLEDNFFEAAFFLVLRKNVTEDNSGAKFVKLCSVLEQNNKKKEHSFKTAIINRSWLGSLITICKFSNRRHKCKAASYTLKPINRASILGIARARKLNQ